MIESRPIPGVLAVALGTILRESGLLVIGIGGCVEVFDVTSDASVGRVLVTIGMTFQTLSRNLSMSPEQRINGIMVKYSTLPRRSLMALSAVLWETDFFMVRICRTSKVLQMTTHTSVGRILITIGMALRTIDAQVASGQFKASDTMIKAIRFQTLGMTR